MSSPLLSSINITHSAHDGINIISPTKTMNMLYNKIENNMGVGISAAILTGEVREAKVVFLRVILTMTRSQQTPCISGWDVLIFPTILEILHRTKITLMITHLCINHYAIGILVGEC